VRRAWRGARGADTCVRLVARGLSSLVEQLTALEAKIAVAKEEVARARQAKAAVEEAGKDVKERSSAIEDQLAKLKARRPAEHRSAAQFGRRRRVAHAG
jgi:dTDP-4-dehydrorhamnose reductase